MKKFSIKSKLKTLPNKYNVKHSRNGNLLLQIHANSLKTDRRQSQIQSWHGVMWTYSGEPLPGITVKLPLEVIKNTNQFKIVSFKKWVQMKLIIHLFKWELRLLFTYLMQEYDFEGKSPTQKPVHFPSHIVRIAIKCEVFTTLKLSFPTIYFQSIYCSINRTGTANNFLTYPFTSVP